MAEIPTPRSDFEAFNVLGNAVSLQILDVLVQGEQMGPTEISQRLGVSKSAVSKAITLFQELGLVDDNGKNTRNKAFFFSRGASAERREEIGAKLDEAMQILAEASDGIKAVIQNPQTDRDSIFAAVQHFTVAAAKVSSVVDEINKPPESLSAAE